MTTNLGNEVTRATAAEGVLATNLATKTDANTAITGATKTKITYDTKGLVTGGADANTNDIASSLDKRYVTDAQLVVIGNTSGINTGDNSVNTRYDGLVTNATHTGDATGATALTVVRINGTLLSGLATGILKNTTGTGIPTIAVAGTDYLTPAGSAASLTNFPTLNQSTTGNAATATLATTANNISGGAQGSIPFQTSGSNTTMLGKGTPGQVLAMNAGATAPEWTTVSSVGTVTVDRGGTGLTSLTDRGVLIGRGTSAISVTASGSAGQVLQSGGPSADPAYSTATYPSSADNAGNILRSDGSNFVSSAINQVQANPGDPNSTNSTTGRMMGLAQLFTPERSGKVLIIISGTINNSGGTNSWGSKVHIRYNTGTAPNNGTALTGNSAGSVLEVTGIASTTRRYPFTLNAIVSGLTVNTEYWIDLGLATISGGTSAVFDLSTSIVEL